MKQTNRTAINLEQMLELITRQKVIKKRNGKIYLANKPRIRKDRVPTRNQRLVQEKSKRCTLYAQRANKDEETRRKYKAMAEEHQTAYNVAFRDAYHTPEVNSIITEGYKGNAGDIIVVEATDDFKVAGLTVEIRDPGDKLIERGGAGINTGELNWIYTVKCQNDKLAGTSIKVTAIDLPGNEGTMEIIL